MSGRLKTNRIIKPVPKQSHERSYLKTSLKEDDKPKIAIRSMIVPNMYLTGILGLGIRYVSFCFMFLGDLLKVHFW